MRLFTRPCLPLLAAALGAFSACGDSATGPVNDLAVTTSTFTSFRVGDLTSVTVTVTNNARSRTYRIVDTPCEDPFTVTAADGTTLPPAPRVCTLNLVAPRELPPGSFVAITHDWRGDVGSTTGGSLGASLAPGTYKVRGFVRTTDGATVTSNGPVTVQVLAK